MPHDTPGPGPCPRCQSRPIVYGTLCIRWECGSWYKADGTASHTKTCHALRHEALAEQVPDGEAVTPMMPERMTNM